jgi:putative endonuclease
VTLEKSPEATSEATPGKTPANIWWVYMIATSKGQIYTGITTDIERRWQEHCAVARGEKAAKGAKFFRSQTPLRIIYREQQPSLSAASQREAVLKKLSHRQKLALSAI